MQQLRLRECQMPLIKLFTTVPARRWARFTFNITTHITVHSVGCPSYLRVVVECGGLCGVLLQCHIATWVTKETFVVIRQLSWWECITKSWKYVGQFSLVSSSLFYRAGIFSFMYSQYLLFYVSRYLLFYVQSVSSRLCIVSIFCFMYRRYLLFCV